MRGWIIHWILSGVALLVVANILPGIQVEGFGSALIAALVIAVIIGAIGNLGNTVKVTLYDQIASAI